MVKYMTILTENSVTKEKVINLKKKGCLLDSDEWMNK